MQMRNLDPRFVSLEFSKSLKLNDEIYADLIFHLLCRTKSIFENERSFENELSNSLLYEQQEIRKALRNLSSIKVIEFFDSPNGKYYTIGKNHCLFVGPRVLSSYRKLYNLGDSIKLSPIFFSRAKTFWDKDYNIKLREWHIKKIQCAKYLSFDGITDFKDRSPATLSSVKNTLSEQEKDVIRKSSAEVFKYLNYGVSAYREELEQKYSSSSWYQHVKEGWSPSRNDLANSSEWTLNQFYAFYVWLLSKRCEHDGTIIVVPHFSPALIKRALGNLKPIYETLSRDQFYRYLYVIVRYFDIIKNRTGQIGQTLALDYKAFSHGLVHSNAIAMIALSDEELKEIERSIN